MTRIVHCPGCRVLLVEPTAGTPLYQCGQCSMVLHAKHAIQSDLQPAGVKGQQQQQPGVHSSALPLPLPPPPPLYTKREAGSSGSGDAEERSKPLYSSASRPLYNPRTSDKPPRDTLLRDMRKLARDAFSNGKGRPTTEAERQNPAPAPAPAPEWKDIGMVVKQDAVQTPASTTGLEDQDFTFYDTSKPRDSDMYDAPAEYKPSDHLSSFGPPSSAKQGNNDNSDPDPPRAASYPRLDSPYVVCQHCKRLLEVPRNLPPCKKSTQKLRCGACQKISRFSVDEAISSPASRGKASSSSMLRNTEGSSSSRISLDLSFDKSPGTSSAPPSFHHRAFGEGKGYDSAPEASAGSHARTDSASSFPTAPCLHELFGYDSPSQFVTHVEQQRSRDKAKGIKGIFKVLQDMSKMHNNVSNRVVINGKLIPEELVKKAERQAGPVHHGSYWYDVRAGFWGVMGGPCLGIIPPCIEEFNHPIPVYCAGGKTRIYVNGRELHHKDLEKLVQRGLPSTPEMSYTIDIDGTVIDLASESEIKGLGRLAPTVESRKAGFGMFPLSHA